MYKFSKMIDMERDALLELLIFSLDNEISEEEQLKLTHALEEDKWLQTQREKLLAMRAFLSEEYRATDRVFDLSGPILEAVEREKQMKFLHGFSSLYPVVAAACIVLFIAVFLHFTFSSDGLSVDTLVGLEDIEIEDAYTYLNFQEAD